MTEFLSIYRVSSGLLILFLTIYLFIIRPQKEASTRLLIIHLLTLGLFVLLKPLSQQVENLQPYSYLLYFRMGLFIVVTAPTLYLAVNTMRYQFSSRKLRLTFIISGVLGATYILTQHLGNFGTINLTDISEYKGAFKAKPSMRYLNQLSQSLACCFYLAATINSLKLRQNSLYRTVAHYLQFVIGPTLFFVIFVFGTATKKWGLIYDGALLFAIFIAIGIMLNIRNAHSRLSEVAQLIEKELYNCLTSVAYDTGSLKSMLNISMFSPLPDTVWLLKVPIICNSTGNEFNDRSLNTLISSQLECPIISTTIRPGETAIAFHHGENSKESMISKSERLREYLGSDKHGGVIIGLGESQSYERLSDSFRQASKAVDFAESVGDNLVMPFDQLPGTHESPAYPYQLRTAFLAELRHWHNTIALEKLELLLTELHRNYHPSIDLFNIHLYELANAIIEAALEAGVPRQRLMSYADFRHLLSATIAENEKFLRNLVKNVCGEVCHMAESRRDTFLYKAEQILLNSFRENPSAEIIASKLNISPSYFMTLFKSKSGSTFAEHLRKLRLNEAKRLLNETNLRICEIADELNFRDASYFSTQFKKETGMTPRQFRKNNIPT